jgi:L-fucose isomerase-like protein
MFATNRQRRKAMSQWNKKPFIDYLNAVDGLIEASTGKLTQQRDIDQVACAQEAGDTPEECARMLERRIKIRGLNDALRSRAQMPSSGSIRDMIFLSRRLSTRPTTDQIEIMDRVRQFEDFTEENDPRGEHDFGAFTYRQQKIFWKID